MLCHRRSGGGLRPRGSGNHAEAYRPANRIDRRFWRRGADREMVFHRRLVL